MPEPAPGVPLVGYSAIVSRLDTLIDVLIAANSAGGTPPRMPRPSTALDRHKAHEARTRHHARVAMVLGGTNNTA